MRQDGFPAASPSARASATSAAVREPLNLSGASNTCIGALGMPLLDWLDRCALPEEARMADADYARAVAAEFVDGLIRAGTTTALVFGAHFASAVDCLFERAATSGVRVSAGLVVSDRLLRPER